MARPIEITIDADTSRVERGTSKVADGFQDVERALDKVSDSAKDTGKDLERGLGDGAKDAARDAERGLKDVERSLEGVSDQGKQVDRDLTEALRSGGDEARKTGRDVEQSFDKAGRATAEFKDEARQNLSETVSSFRGDMEDIPQIAQDVLGGVSANLGALGGAITVGLAAAIGITIAQMQKLAEENTEVKQSIADLAREMYDAGGQLDAADIDGKIADIAFALAQDDKAWTFWKDEAQTNIGLVKEALEGVGDSATARDAFKGLAGDLEAAARAQDGLARANEDAKRAQEDHYSVTADGLVILDSEGRAIQEGIDARNRLSEEIETQTGVQQGANDEVTYYTEIMGQSEAATEAAADAIRDRADALDESATAAMDLVEAENAQVEALAEANAVIAENGRTLDVNTEAGRSNRGALVDLAGALNEARDASIAAGEGADVVAAKVGVSREQFILAAEAAGHDKTAAEALATAYGLIPENVATQVAAYGTDEAKAAVEGVAAPTEAPVNVTTQGTEAGAQGAVNSVQGTTAPVEVTTEGTDAAVQGRIEGIRGKEVKVDVDDMLTVRAVQDRINGIQGKEVRITAVLDTAQFYRDLAAATAARSMTVTVNQRKGEAVI